MSSPVKQRQSAFRAAQRAAHGPAQRNKFRLSAIDRLYMIVAFIESFLVTSLVLAAFLILEIRAGVGIPRVRGTSLYMTTFILSSIFSLLYAYDALRAHNVVQLVLHLAFELFLLAWSAVEVWQAKTAVSGLDLPGACFFRAGVWDCTGRGTVYAAMFPVMTCVPIVIFTAMIIFIGVSCRVYEEFGWEVYKVVHASMELKRMHRNYQTFMSLIKLLFFFALVFCMMYLIIIPLMWKRTSELIITVIALPIFYPTLGLLIYGVKRENVFCMVVGIFILGVAEAYFAYKLTTLFTISLYATCRYTLVVLSSFAILFNAATIIYAMICLSQFGKGLRDAHDDHEQERTQLNKQNKQRQNSKSEDIQDEYVLSAKPFLID